MERSNETSVVLESGVPSARGKLQILSKHGSFRNGSVLSLAKSPRNMLVK